VSACRRTGESYRRISETAGGRNGVMAFLFSKKIKIVGCFPMCTRDGLFILPYIAATPQSCRNIFPTSQMTTWRTNQPMTSGETPQRRLAKLREEFGEVFVAALADPATVGMLLSADGTLWQERLRGPERWRPIDTRL
jgi:hypothetical protein